MSRIIKELISLEDARMLIGAMVQGHTAERAAHDPAHGMRGTVNAVGRDRDGDLEFSLEGEDVRVYIAPNYHQAAYWIEVLAHPADTLPRRLAALKAQRLTLDTEIAGLERLALDASGDGV